MIRAVADTHVVIWHLYQSPRLSKTVKQVIEDAVTTGQRIAISSITLAEIVYLIEKQRIHHEAFDLLWTALGRSDVTPIFQEIVLTKEVIREMQAISRQEVPDLPDRLIAATALYLNVPLLTRDAKIRATQIETIW